MYKVLFSKLQNTIEINQRSKKMGRCFMFTYSKNIKLSILHNLIYGFIEITVKILASHFIGITRF